MKNIFQYIFALLCLITGTDQLYAQWTQTNGPSGGAVRKIVVSSTNLFAAVDSAGVFVSTDNGTNWTTVNSGLTNLYVWALVTDGTNLLAGTNGDGVFISANNGTNWTQDGFSGDFIHCLTVSGSNVFAGYVNGVYRSNDSRTSWTPFNTGLTSKDVTCFAVSPNGTGGTNLFAGTFVYGTSAGGVFLSTDDGSNWTKVSTGLTNLNIWALAASNKNLFAGTYKGGIFLSTDNGTNWTAVNTGLTNTDIYCFAVSGTNLFAGTHGSGVFLSTDNGTSWTQVNTGLPPNTVVYSLGINGTNLLAGVGSSGVWRRPLSDMITGVENLKSELPKEFSLQQNYPNPFNPSTNISFTLPSKSFVSLKVFDLIGREVATIVSEEMSAGSYARTWNASAFSSGVYFYRLTAGTFVQTHKLCLLR